MGRSKEYVRTEVLDKAMNQFWRSGYAHTTIRDLEKAMGINQFSIYNSFTSKADLYREVLERYSSTMHRTNLRNLSSKDANISDIRDFFEQFASCLLNKEMPNSCMMVNSILMFEQFPDSIRQVVNTFFDSIESYLRIALENSKEKGMVRPDLDVETEARYLLSISQSLSVIHFNKKKSEIETYIDHALTKLK
ncbi:MAG: TetR/AcrR family transcriptional regulator [Flavobacteriaceae bacterium]|nr:TetR/AcrR family transcriptional regulator [Flavobacteriaceae bacterium]